MSCVRVNIGLALYLITFLGCVPLLRGQHARGPFFTVHPKDETWDISQKGRVLLCAALGDPHPSIRWQKNGHPLPTTTERISMSYLNGNSKKALFAYLTFATLLKKDEGEYRCLAVNDAGSVQSQVSHLTIFGPPIVNPKNPSPQELYISWDEEFSIPCIAKGPPSVIKLTWYYKAFANERGRPTVQGHQAGSLLKPHLTTLPNKRNAERLRVRVYHVYCSAENSKGRAHSTTTKVYLLQAPDAPAITNVSPLQTIVQIDYTVTHDATKPIETCSAQLESGDISPRSYRLEVPKSGAENRKVIPNLKPITSYNFKARCRNRIGFSQWTPVYNFTTRNAAPDQPPMDTAAMAITETSVSVTWLPIPDDYTNGKILGYKIKVLEADSPIEQKVHKVTPDVLNLVIGTLTPGKEYWFRTLGFTSAGDGPWSDFITVTMPKMPRPEPPVIESIRANSEMVWIKFSSKTGPGTKCTIQIKNQKGTFTNSVNVNQNITEFTMSSLAANSEYAAKIQCKHDKGTSDWSKPRLFKTPEGKPGKAPVSLTLKETDEHHILASWKRFNADDLNGNFSGYNICFTAAVATGKTKCVDSIQHEDFTFKSVSPQTTYSVTVATCTSSGCGPFCPSKLLHTSSWIRTTGVPTTADTTPADTTPAYETATAKATNPISTMVIVLSIVGFIVLAGIALGVFFCMRKRQKARNANGHSAAYIAGEPGVTLEYDQVPDAVVRPRNADTLNPYYTPLLANSSMVTTETMEKLKGVELKRERLKICKVLGEGEFGCVYKGKLLPRSTSGSQKSIDVAIKTMKMNEFDASEREEFVKEGLRMKNLDNVNVMQLVGICLPETGNNTNGINQIRLSGYEAVSPLVVIPYMENGDLRSYLYLARTTNDADHLTLNKLLGFIHDIANGMEYLSGKNIIHRDLACRNCMLDSKMHVVVSDFGLSRQIYSSNYYRQRRVAKMPVKWMALESLRDRIYTSHTDVWSFGVTAWEVFTFCQNPYPGVANHEMHDLLKSGTRLKQPPKCPDDVWYDAVFPCWDPRPEERPSFTELMETLKGFLEAYPEGFTLESPGAPGYVNVMPPDYEKLTSTAQTSKQQDEAPMPYDTAVAKDAGGQSGQKKVLKQSRPKDNKVSGKRPLLQAQSREHDDDDSDIVVNL